MSLLLTFFDFLCIVIDKIFSIFVQCNGGVMKPKEILPSGKYGVILPGSDLIPNESDPDFPHIREELRKRGIIWYERAFGRSTVFWFLGEEALKLPEDPEGVNEGNQYLQYLPVSDDCGGHGIGSLDDFLAANPGEDLKSPKYGELLVLGKCYCYMELIAYAPFRNAVTKTVPLNGNCGFCNASIRASLVYEEDKTSPYGWKITVENFTATPRK